MEITNQKEQINKQCHIENNGISYEVNYSLVDWFLQNINGSISKEETQLGSFSAYVQDVKANPNINLNLNSKCTSDDRTLILADIYQFLNTLK